MQIWKRPWPRIALGSTATLPRTRTCTHTCTPIQTVVLPCRYPPLALQTEREQLQQLQSGRRARNLQTFFGSPVREDRTLALRGKGEGKRRREGARGSERLGDRRSDGVDDTRIRGACDTRTSLERLARCLCPATRTVARLYPFWRHRKRHGRHRRRCAAARTARPRALWQRRWRRCIGCSPTCAAAAVAAGCVGTAARGRRSAWAIGGQPTRGMFACVFLLFRSCPFCMFETDHAHNGLSHLCRICVTSMSHLCLSSLVSLLLSPFLVPSPHSRVLRSRHWQLCRYLRSHLINTLPFPVLLGPGHHHPHLVMFQVRLLCSLSLRNVFWFLVCFSALHFPLSVRCFLRCFLSPFLHAEPIPCRYTRPRRWHYR